MESAELNIGNIWVKKCPGYTLYPLMKSHDDSYGDFETKKEIQQKVHSTELLPFSDAMIEVKEDYEQWSIAFDEKFANHFNIPKDHGVRYVPSQFCACMIVNMGEIGDFNRSIIDQAVFKIKAMNYEIIGEPRGFMLCRGYKDKKFRRLLEIQVPIQKP